MQAHIIGTLLAIGLITGCGGIDDGRSAGSTPEQESDTPAQMDLSCGESCFQSLRKCRESSTTSEEVLQCLRRFELCSAACPVEPQ